MSGKVLLENFDDHLGGGTAQLVHFNKIRIVINRDDVILAIEGE